MDDIKKTTDGPNTVTVGHICLSCGLLATRTCPYNNHKKTSVMTFAGDIRGKCNHYNPILKNASGESKMIKTADKMTDTELNISLYKRIYAMNKEEQESFEKFWSQLFPKDYAKDMADNNIKSGQRGVDKLTPKNDMNEKEDPDVAEKIAKKTLDDQSTKTWFKKTKRN